MLQPTAMGTNSSEIKAHNLSAILLTLLHNQNMSRVSLAQLIGVSTATITNLVAELVADGLIVEKGLVQTDGQPNVGRPQRALELVPNARFAIGIHIDVGMVYIALTNLEGYVLQSHQFEHNVDTPWQNVMDDIVVLVEATLSEARLTPEQIVGVGVAASGIVDAYSGINLIAPNLNWHNVPIGDYLQDKLNLPVVVENNVRAMALGEAYFGTDRNSTALAFIYARIGVGAGFIVNGNVYRGGGAGAGEIGHTTLILESDDEKKLHTLESLIARPAILKAAAQIIKEQPDCRLALQIQHQKLTLEAIFKAAEAGDEAIITMLEERAFYAGIALANLTNIFNPEVIVLGGMFIHERNLLLPTIEQTLRQYSFAHLGNDVRLRITDFGDDAGIIGAAALALDRCFYRSQAHLHTRIF